MHKCGLTIFTAIPRQLNDSKLSTQLVSRTKSLLGEAAIFLTKFAKSRIRQSIKDLHVYTKKTQLSTRTKNNRYCPEVRLRIYRTTRWFLEVKLKRASARDGNPSCEKAFPKFDNNTFCCYHTLWLNCQRNDL